MCVCVRGCGVCNAAAQQMRAEFDAQQKEVSVVRSEVVSAQELNLEP